MGHNFRDGMGQSVGLRQRLFGAEAIEHDGRSMKATLTAQESG
jgi:hypothetical protein